MILDKQAEFSDSQAITATAISTNVMDTGALNVVGSLQPNAGKNLGGDAGLFLVVQVDTTFAGTAGTLTPTLETDTTANLATAPVVIAGLGTFAQAVLLAGATLATLPLPFASYKRYMGMRWTVGGTITAGAVSAFLTRNPTRWVAYPNAIA